MGLFDFFKKTKSTVESDSKEELYGKAWLMIVGNAKQDGLDTMKRLASQGYSEAEVVLAMFSPNPADRKQYIQKAAEKGNVEAIWESTGFINHSFCPDMSNADDKKWVDTVLLAAEKGSVDAMNEMGNICNRWGKYAESMYWYAMADAHGHPDGQVSINAVAKKWNLAGASHEYEKGTENFSEARFECAMVYLEMNAGLTPTVSLDTIVRRNLDGVPLAAYLSGDCFEAIDNPEMAYRMYNVISHENDPHGLKRYADMLFTGNGVDRDLKNAARFYQMAAERGERDAMFIMGELTKNTNKNKSAYWYGLAHTRGNSNALPRLIQLSL